MIDTSASSNAADFGLPSLTQTTQPPPLANGSSLESTNRLFEGMTLVVNDSTKTLDAGRFHLVRVTTDDRTHQLWAAATSREEAVDRVLDAIPEGWAGVEELRSFRSSMMR